MKCPKCQKEMEPFISIFRNNRWMCLDCSHYIDSEDEVHD